MRSNDRTQMSAKSRTTERAAGRGSPKPAKVTPSKTGGHKKFGNGTLRMFYRKNRTVKVVKLVRIKLDIQPPNVVDFHELVSDEGVYPGHPLESLGSKLKESGWTRNSGSVSRKSHNTSVRYPRSRKTSVKERDKTPVRSRASSPAARTKSPQGRKSHSKSPFRLKFAEPLEYISDLCDEQGWKDRQVAPNYSQHQRLAYTKENKSKNKRDFSKLDAGSSIRASSRKRLKRQGSVNSIDSGKVSLDTEIFDIVNEIKLDLETRKGDEYDHINREVDKTLNHALTVAQSLKDGCRTPPINGSRHRGQQVGILKMETFNGPFIQELEEYREGLLMRAKEVEARSPIICDLLRLKKRRESAIEAINMKQKAEPVARCEFDRLSIEERRQSFNMDHLSESDSSNPDANLSKDAASGSSNDSTMVVEMCQNVSRDSLPDIVSDIHDDKSEEINPRSSSPKITNAVEPSSSNLNIFDAQAASNACSATNSGLSPSKNCLENSFSSSSDGDASSLSTSSLSTSAKNDTLLDITTSSNNSATDEGRSHSDPSQVLSINEPAPGSISCSPSKDRPPVNIKQADKTNEVLSAPHDKWELTDVAKVSMEVPSNVPTETVDLKECHPDENDGDSKTISEATISSRQTDLNSSCSKAEFTSSPHQTKYISNSPSKTKPAACLTSEELAGLSIPCANPENLLHQPQDSAQVILGHEDKSPPTLESHSPAKVSKKASPNDLESDLKRKHSEGDSHSISSGWSPTKSKISSQTKESQKSEVAKCKNSDFDVDVSSKDLRSSSTSPREARNTAAEEAKTAPDAASPDTGRRKSKRMNLLPLRTPELESLGRAEGLSDELSITEQVLRLHNQRATSILTSDVMKMPEMFPSLNPKVRLPFLPGFGTGASDTGGHSKSSPVSSPTVNTTGEPHPASSENCEVLLTANDDPALPTASIQAASDAQNSPSGSAESAAGQPNSVSQEASTEAESRLAGHVTPPECSADAIEVPVATDCHPAERDPSLPSTSHPLDRFTIGSCGDEAGDLSANSAMEEDLFYEIKPLRPTCELKGGRNQSSGRLGLKAMFMMRILTSLRKLARTPFLNRPLAFRSFTFDASMLFALRQREREEAEERARQKLLATPECESFAATTSSQMQHLFGVTRKIPTVNANAGVGVSSFGGVVGQQSPPFGGGGGTTTTKRKFFKGKNRGGGNDDDSVPLRPFKFNSRIRTVISKNGAIQTTVDKSSLTTAAAAASSRVSAPLSATSSGSSSADDKLESFISSNVSRYYKIKKNAKRLNSQLHVGDHKRHRPPIKVRIPKDSLKGQSLHKSRKSSSGRSGRRQPLLLKIHKNRCETTASKKFSLSSSQSAGKSGESHHHHHRSHRHRSEAAAADNDGGGGSSSKHDKKRKRKRKRSQTENFTSPKRMKIRYKNFYGRVIEYAKSLEPEDAQ